VNEARNSFCLLILGGFHRTDRGGNESKKRSRTIKNEKKTHNGHHSEQQKQSNLCGMKRQSMKKEEAKKT
jgi:hypothetical protein